MRKNCGKFHFNFFLLGTLCGYFTMIVRVFVLCEEGLRNTKTLKAELVAVTSLSSCLCASW